MPFEKNQILILFCLRTKHIYCHLIHLFDFLMFFIKRMMYGHIAYKLIICMFWPKGIVSAISGGLSMGEHEHVSTLALLGNRTISL